jgi:hypothetical protein
VVESRFEEFVFQDQPLVLAQPIVNLAQGLGQPVLSGAHVALARVVRAVGEPDLQIPRSGLVHYLDALIHVVHRLAPDRRIAVREAAELVVIVLEGIAVYRAEADP